MTRERFSLAAFVYSSLPSPLLGLIVFSLCPFWTFAQTNIARTPSPTNNVLVMVQGKVETAPAGTDAWKPASRNQILQPGDKIQTATNSRAMVYLTNGTTMKLDAASGAPVVPSRENSFWKGISQFFSRPRGGWNFNKSGANGAVRGTDFLVEATETNFVITMLDGTIDVTNASGQSETVTTLQSIAIENNGAVNQPVAIEATNVNHLVQWSLYYPGVLNVDELQLSTDEKLLLNASITNYRAGDLMQAVANYPWNTQPLSEDAKAYQAGLLLSVGQVDQAEVLLQVLPANSVPARALNLVILAVKFPTNPPAVLDQQPTSSTEWLALSYYRQSQTGNDRDALKKALDAARAATANSPEFGFAWARMAELEFSFRHILKARDALKVALQKSPRNAQAIALNGFLFAAQDRISDAIAEFENAMEVDSALGNAWLGRGLCFMRQGRRSEGLRDLIVAASLEPQRSLLRSYLGKAFADTGDERHAEKEFKLAEGLDPNDPTSWLYAAIFHQEEHRFNEGIRDLEESLEKNDNRRIYRSQLLLDEDRAMRSASLAAIYRDAGMTDVSVREAASAVTYDYANYSAHLFLANSFDALRDPTRFNLRYETAWFNELLLANLLAPVEAGTFSQDISQQEYSRLFDVKKFGLTTTTDVRSDGQYREIASQFGTAGKFGYSLDLDYQHNDETGARDRLNNGLDRIEWYSTLKYQVTASDMLFIQTKYQDYHSGDNFQYYDAAATTTNFNRLGLTNLPVVRTNFSFDEYQKPLLVAGYHHEWAPGVHTLVLGGRLENDQRFSDTLVPELIVTKGESNQVVRVTRFPFDVSYRSQFEAYTAELTQLFQTERQTLVLGGRAQTGDFKTTNTISIPPQGLLPIFADLYASPPATTNLEEHFQRTTVYSYYTVEPLERLFLTGGVSYDRVEYPLGFRSPPVSSGEDTKELVGPKAAIVYSPWDWLAMRGIYARSLGGVSLDQSFRLEPTSLAGFIQSFRSVMPESVVGSVSAPTFDTYGAALDLKFPSGTYLGIQAEWLSSEANRQLGVFDSIAVRTPERLASSTRELLEFDEKSAAIVLNQMVADQWSIGVSYRFTSSKLNDRLPDIPISNVFTDSNNTDRSDLHQVGAYLLFNHPCGLFARADANWYAQDNILHTFDTNSMPVKVHLASDEFAQVNLFVGWRFPRQLGDVTFGVLNVGGDDYHLNPLNSYAELPHERVFTAQVRLRF